MNTRIFLCLLGLVIFSCLVSSETTKIAPEFEINLDLAPEQRWSEIAKHYSSYAPKINAYFQNIAKSLPKVVVKMLQLVGSGLDRILGDYGKEIKGISQGLGVDLGTLVILNFSYELRRLGGPPSNSTGMRAGACTSIVAQDVNQAMLHGRNMDWNLPNDMRELTFTGVFKRGGKEVFRGTCFIGFVGVLTGFSIHDQSSFGVTIDERLLGGSPIVDSLEGLLKGGWSPSHLIRYALETSTDYDSAISTLTTKHLTAPAYLIVSGNKAGQGAVITRDRNSIADLWTLTGGSKKTVDPNIQKWYLLQTNYDHWNQPPSSDNRRGPGISYMNKVGQNNINPDTLLGVMGTWPVNNNHTTYTAIMDYKAKKFTTHIRFL